MHAEDTFYERHAVVLTVVLLVLSALLFALPYAQRIRETSLNF